MIYLRLFYEFFKVGLFSVGGGLATLPFLSSLGASSGWFAQSDIADMLAVSESTPGAIGVNMSTYVGYTVGGIPGAVIATVGLVAPSIIIIILISKLLMTFAENRFVKSAFYGLRPASCGLISAAGWSVFKIALFNLSSFTGISSILSVINWPCIFLCAVLFLLMRLFDKLHPVVFIAISAVIGIVFRLGGAAY